MTAWSTDMAAAPRGRRVKTSKVIKGKTHTSVVIEREPVWLASKCGRVIRSHWIWPSENPRPGEFPYGRWCMFGGFEREQPLAWRPFIEGEFPRGMVDNKPTWPNGKGPEFPAMILGVAA